MLTIFTDTDTDITPKIASEYNTKLISMPYIENEEINYPYKIVMNLILKLFMKN